MLLSEKEYLERTYAGFLGMNIGIRLGAPVEPTLWTSDRIRRFYGDITSYVKPFINFAADDDVNGPVYFLRAFEDKADDSPLTPSDVAEAWLNYAREGVGMFWWGGYGVSTEHTAYLNLKNGVKAPSSGSAAVNGLERAEQIGGQIFIDTWGFINPRKPEEAARMAVAAASVSHDGNGLYGAAFIASMIAAAYSESDPESLIATGLKHIPSDSTYAAVVNAVLSFHKENSEDWRACLKYLQDNWGYDKYGGVCHIIPNAGVCVMAILYGRTFSRSIEIATMAGWDTDCNAGNVGSVMGVAGGLEAIPEHYRKPVNDFVVLSGISGYLNVVDIPSYIHKLYDLSLKNEGTVSHTAPPDGTLDLTFDLPGSTHALRVSDENKAHLVHSEEVRYDGHGSLEIGFARMARGERFKVYYKSFYRRADFNDERYSPVFSPTAYPGQTVKIVYRVEKFNGETVCLSPYIRTSTGRELSFDGRVVRESEGWDSFVFTIPDLEGEWPEEIGLLFESNSPSKFFDYGALYIGEFKIDGKAGYRVDTRKLRKEFGSVLGFSHNHGAWEVRPEGIECMGLDHAEAMTGNYYMKNAVISFNGTLSYGSSLLASLRVQGAERGYYAGLHDGKMVIARTVGGKLEIIREKEFRTEMDRSYRFSFSVNDTKLSLSIDGEHLETEDRLYDHGMAGFALYRTGRALVDDFKVEEY